ncbi:MAG: hypothetical protein K0S07_156 [Chlamydiales bacterium]|jgi:hypothetical protein|nr:hypothetical protein [Chlamydiales bacterium]
MIKKTAVNSYLMLSSLCLSPPLQADFFGVPVQVDSIIEGKPLSYYIDRKNQLLREHIELFKEYVDADPIDCSQGSYKKIKNIGLEYMVRSPKPVSIEKAKELLVKGLQDLLYRINQDEILRPGLDYYPFTSKNLFYSLIFADEKGEIYFFPLEEKSLDRVTCIETDYKALVSYVHASQGTSVEVYRAALQDVLEEMKKEKPELLQPLTKGDRFAW